MEVADHPVLLFDGVCNLCNGVVKWLIQRDKKGLIHYASLQSDVGKALAARHGINAAKLDSIVLVTNNQALTKSSAAIKVAEFLGGSYRLITLGRLIPRPLRDLIYDFVARNRYRWFGRKAHCMLPRPEWRSRFLD